MSTPNNTADKFVLLFSADWYRPYWGMLGLVPGAALATPFQTEMREAVAGILGDAACYWDVSFSKSRLGQTRDALFGGLNRHSAHESKLGFIRALVEGRDPHEALTEFSMAFWDDYEAKLNEISQADFQATGWDRHLAALTPDLPTLLQDFALILMSGAVLRRPTETAVETGH
jgi:hypothetical protein